MKTLTIFKIHSNRKYTTFVSTSKGEVCVQFEPVVMWGHIDDCIYGTNNEEVIEGLKKSPLFGSFIYIAKEGIEQDVQTTEVEVEKTPYDYLADPANAVKEELVTSVGTAQLWLQKTHGETFNATKAADIKNEAAMRFNTLFPNWR